MNHINICPNCMHRNTCVLTAQKDKVWSCSEYDETTSSDVQIEITDLPEQKKEQVLQLV